MELPLVLAVAAKVSDASESFPFRSNPENTRRAKHVLNWPRRFCDATFLLSSTFLVDVTGSRLFVVLLVVVVVLDVVQYLVPLLSDRELYGNMGT